MKRGLLIILCLLCMLINLLAFSVSAETPGDYDDNTTWSLSDAGVLTISGSGAIRDYIYSGANLWPLIKAPWRNHASKIKEVVVQSGITRIGDNAFCCLPNVTSVSIADTVTSIGQAAFCDMTALTQITLPDSVVEVEKNLFHGCKSLATVKLPSGLKNLTGGMFKSCSSLKSIELPKGIKEIQGATFESAGLTSITIPEGVTSINADAFQFCRNLKTVKLPTSLKKIGLCAFDSSAITSIIIPKNVTHIVQSAFSRCHNLKSIRFEGDAPEMDSHIFMPITTTAYYPKNNPTWTEAVRQNYGGKITWIACCESEHIWGQWKEEQKATCAKEGLEIRGCTQCVVTEEKSIAKIAHQYQAAVTPSTCKNEGFTTHTCKVCNDTYTDSKTPTVAHNFGEWTVTKEATCLEKGTKQRSCIVCNKREAEEIVLTGHAYQDEVTAPSGTQPGFTTHICTVCGHSFVDTYTEATEPTNSESTATTTTISQEETQSTQSVEDSEEQTDNIPQKSTDRDPLTGVIAVIAAGVVVAAVVVVAIVFLKKRSAK